MLTCEIKWATGARLERLQYGEGDGYKDQGEDQREDEGEDGEVDVEQNGWRYNNSH